MGCEWAIMMDGERGRGRRREFKSTFNPADKDAYFGPDLRWFANRFTLP